VVNGHSTYNYKKFEVLHMSKNVRIAFYAIIGLITIGVAANKSFADAPITVTVDNRVINFPGTQPIETNGSVLVPLRGVFEALHAQVDYDSSSSTITATHHGSTVVVPIGSTTATINGQSQQLSQPAEVVNGTTLVPLRFVAEAFGDYVGWNGSTHTVVIQRQHDVDADAGQNSPPPPGPPSAPSNNVVEGRLQRVLTNQQPPQIVVRAYGQNQTIPLSHDVTIQRGRHHDDVTSASLTDLQPGDHVSVHENDHGRAESITATFGQDGPIHH
jgi:hypothetical protein